jgi:glutathione synthase/RimK-type ligase-like ATP-grasp enzyme
MNPIAKLRVAILNNENPLESQPWIRACEALSARVEFDSIDLISNTWLDQIRSGDYDLLLARPGGVTANYKQLYDERVYVLANVLNYNIFPSPIEIFIYENKRFLSFWLKAANVPSPITDVFYNKKEAIEYLTTCTYPFVAKTNIGASGSGVIILKNQKEGIEYVESVFDGKGAPQRTGPNLIRGGLFRRGLNYLFHPSEIGRKLNLYRLKSANLQKDFVLFQEYIEHDFEWRVVRIGESFFAHKKIPTKGKASGSLLKLYDNPPLELFDFVKDITDKHRLYSLAIDIFESPGGYLINEMQCFFGQSDPYQMLVDGIPGRYLFVEGNWIFEKGDFAKNMCYDLRLEASLDMIRGNHAISPDWVELKKKL